MAEVDAEVLDDLLAVLDDTMKRQEKKTKPDGEVKFCAVCKRKLAKDHK